MILQNTCHFVQFSQFFFKTNGFVQCLTELLKIQCCWGNPNKLKFTKLTLMQTKNSLKMEKYRAVPHLENFGEFGKQTNH